MPEFKQFYLFGCLLCFVVVVTRAASSRSSANSPDDDMFSTPVKNLASPSPRITLRAKTLPTPPKKNRSRMLPGPVSSFTCRSCRLSVNTDLVDSTSTLYFSDFNDSLKSINSCVSDIKFTLDRVKSKINEIEESMRDHTEAINELERNIALFANTIRPSNKVCSVATGAPEPENVSNQELSVPLFADILKALAPRLKSAVNRRPQLELGKGALGAAVTHARHGNKTLFIMGDSNTRHVHLGGESVSQTRCLLTR